MTQSQYCSRLAMSLDPDHSTTIIACMHQESEYEIRNASCTFGHVSWEPVGQWQIGERKLLPESTHSPFHHLHGSRAHIHEFDISYMADK